MQFVKGARVMPIEGRSREGDQVKTRRDLVSEILEPEKWPTPKWYDERKAAKGAQTYEEYFTFQLQAKYLELENDFRSVLGNYSQGGDIVVAGRIDDLLHSAKESLEHANPSLLMVSSVLDLVERYMVWLYPDWMARARISTILLKLGSLSFKGKDSLVSRLARLSELEKESYPGQFRATLDETIGAINHQAFQGHIGRGLQINRLRLLRNWGLVILVIFLIGSPFAINISDVRVWPSYLIAGESDWLIAWMNAFAMLLMGAVGGFLSGLLQARSTQVTLAEYLENMLKLQLRPLVGALVALILYVLLSWQVLPGISMESAGSYFIIAFLSGFSERYFLRLLDIETESSEPGDQPEVETESGESSAESQTPRSVETPF
jgi:hypothetical protein